MVVIGILLGAGLALYQTFARFRALEHDDEPHES